MAKRVKKGYTCGICRFWQKSKYRFEPCEGESICQNCKKVAAHNWRKAGQIVSFKDYVVAEIIAKTLMG